MHHEKLRQISYTKIMEGLVLLGIGKHYIMVLLEFIVIENLPAFFVLEK